MRSSGYEKLSVIDRAMAEFNKIAKGKAQSEFSMKGIDTQKKTDLLRKQLRKFLSSDWTTSKGRKNILQKRISSFMKSKENGGKWGLSEQETLTLFDIFASDEYHKAIEKQMLSSDQIIDMVRKNGETKANQFEKALKSLVKSDTPPEESRLFVESELQANDTV